MRIPFSILFVVVLSLHSFAAPVPTADVGDEFALEVRKTKGVVKKPSATKVKVSIKKAPVVKAKPLPKKVVPAKKVSAPAPKPVVKAKPLPKKVVAKPAAVQSFSVSSFFVLIHIPRLKKKVTVSAKKSTTKTSGKKVATPAKKPVAKAPVKPVTGKKTVTGSKVPPKSGAKAKPSTSKEPAGVFCPVRPPANTTTKPKKPKRILSLLNAFAREATIARRTLFGLIKPRLTEGNEFIGWHGTNERTAALWESTGHIIRPETAEGRVTGRSGLDEELGPGLYIADTLSVAESAAVANSLNNKIPGKVCAVFARSSANWREARDKILIPEAIRGNRPINGDETIREQERQSYIALLPRKPPTSRTPSVLFGPIRTETGRVLSQMMIVESLNPNFEAQCFDLVGADSAGAQAFEAAGNTVSYTDPTLFAQWGIRPEDKEITDAVIAAFEKPCSRP
ncbi:hypothetical protein DFH09DRAFT_1360963 [Mycena vulgaris]|nr:hypothetical protein DFH09DRAFT_1360963 [Mycena vulgaris]